MLVTLDIRDLLIIDHLTLEFSEGLNVLTGETGAGKSILLDALGFVLGWRGRASLVREGAERGEVIAEFECPPDHPARAVLRAAELPDPEDDLLILRRVTTQEGRKTAFVNDRRVSAEIMRQLSDTLIELHGQHDDRGLLNPRGHREILDRYAVAAKGLVETRRCWADARRAQKAVTDARQSLEVLAAEEEFLRHAVAELDALRPEPLEEGKLDGRRRLMQAAQRIREDIQRAHQVLGPEGAEGAMSDATRWLEGAADLAEGRLEAPLAALGRAMAELGDATEGVEACLDALDFDPLELEATEERLFAIRALARKHDVAADDLAELAEGFGRRIAALDAGDGDLARLCAAADLAETRYQEAAKDLSELRRKAAQRLDQSVMAELVPLKMERAVFRTEVKPAEPGPEGADEVTFTVATNPGAPAGPLARIASGGELSRFLLALKVCLRGKDDSATMIFDEIDRGVGGATADAVGRRLAALAAEGQVLVVTHAPQVAARASGHWRVEKRVSQDETTTHVAPLDSQMRIDEIARMLSGDRITDAARDAARALLAG